MRWKDMIPGEAYVLAGERPVKVIVLETPAEVRRRARVRVRFESGVTAGRVSELPSRRICARWDRSPAPTPLRRRLQDGTVVGLPRAPGVGDKVTLADTGELLWTVRTLDGTSGQATIASVIFDQPHTRVVGVDELRVQVKTRARRPVGHMSRRDAGPAAVAALAKASEGAAERLRPVQPRRELDELMDDVLFSPACLREYDRRSGSDTPGTPVERLREEVRRAGFIVRENLGPGEYARVRVLRRFDIVLPSPPTADASVTVKQLRFLAREKSRGARGRRPAGQRRAA